MSLKASRVGLLLVAGLLILAPTLLLQSSDGDRAGATYSQGSLRVTIPYRARHSGSGQLSIDLLSPEDEVVGHAERRVEVDAGKARWHEELKLEKPPGFEEVVWHRLRYRFTYAGEKDPAVSGIASVSEILRMPVIHVMGQQSYLAGGSAALRVVVTDRNNQTVGGTLRIVLQTGGKSHSLFTGRLNRRGTAEAQFRFPAGLSGSYQLRYVVDTPIGSAEFMQQVRLQDKVSILLTTEKPIYQPGQTIHVRALALDRANHAAAAARKLTFEVEDSRGNKVFKKATQTDQFGIASAEFALADEVNLGTYHLRALMDGASTRAEVALNVERYVLPKFKVAVEFAGKTGEARLPAGRSRDGNGARQLLLRQAGGWRRGHGEGVRHGRGAVRGGVRAGQDGCRRRLSFRPHAAQLFRRTAARSGRGARAGGGHGEGFRRPCRNARRADHGERIAADPHGGARRAAR